MAEEVCTLVGVGPGVSLAVARRFAQEGYALGLVARNAEKLQGYVDALRAEGIEAQGVAADASDAEALKGALATIHDQLGHTAILVYNAAVITQGPPSQIDPEAFVATFRVNVVGALVAAQACIPHMREAGQGMILFTGGGLALYPAPAYSSLAVGKAALRNLTKSMHDELKGDGIHVATVTIAGFVQEGTYFDPANIAEVYYQLYAQSEGHLDWEIIYAQPQE